MKIVNVAFNGCLLCGSLAVASGGDLEITGLRSDEG
jgi:hypothetical protein